jgi:periplasmic protein CpxP/Spy
MKRLVYHILFASLTFLLTWAAPARAQDQGSSSAQSPGDNQTQQRQRQWRRGGMRRQRQNMGELAKKLDLTDAQKQQFQQIGQETRKKGMAIRQDSSLTEEQKKEKMQALRKQSHQQMFGVLTQEQKDKLKAMREQRQKDQDKSKAPGDQASGKKKAVAPAADDGDPFAGMTSDDDDGPGSGSGI